MAKAFRSIAIKKLICNSTRGREMGTTDQMLVPKNSGMMGEKNSNPPPFYFFFPVISLPMPSNNLKFWPRQQC